MKREIPFGESMIEILDRNNNVEQIVGLIHTRAHSLGDEMLILFVKRLVDLLDGKISDEEISINFEDLALFSALVFEGRHRIQEMGELPYSAEEIAEKYEQFRRNQQ